MLLSRVRVLVFALLPPLYLQNIDQTFLLLTTARAVIHDSFIDTSGSTLNTSVSTHAKQHDHLLYHVFQTTLRILKTPSLPSGPAIPYLEIILPIVFGLIFLIILSIILYAVSKILIAPFMSLRQYCLLYFLPVRIFPSQAAG